MVGLATGRATYEISSNNIKRRFDVRLMSGEGH